MRRQGKIAKWNDERGFGFISPFEGGDSVFVHISSFPPSDRRPSRERTGELHTRVRFTGTATG